MLAVWLVVPVLPVVPPDPDEPEELVDPPLVPELDTLDVTLDVPGSAEMSKTRVWVR
jgi:hypothetical protein